MLEKKKALEMAVLQIEKQFGKGSIMKLGDDADKMNLSVIPSGSLALDIALGVGGFPRGRVIGFTVLNHQENHSRLACHCRSTEAGRLRGLY